MRQQRLTAAHTAVMQEWHTMAISHREIARRLGVTEGAIRYQRRQQASGAVDGRTQKPSQLARYHPVIAFWVEEAQEAAARPTLTYLQDQLQQHLGYQGSYDALRRYVRKHFPALLKKRARLRIETPPGQLLPLDWKEQLRVQIGAPGHWVTVHALCFSLSVRRKSVVRVLDSQTLPAFLHGHQEAFRPLGGLPAVLRPDGLGTAIQRWQGEQSVLNPQYHRYLQQLDLAVFPSRPGTPTDKGKIEKRIQDLFRQLDLPHRVFPSLTALQALIDATLARLEPRWRCGATGLTIAESFAYEQPTLRPLPAHFPVLPLAEARRPVCRDGTVAFQGNYYQVPDMYRGKTIVCLHTGQEICCYHQGTLMARFPHLPGTQGMVRLHAEALQTTPMPLSDTVRAWALEVAERQVEIYHTVMQRRAG